MLETQHILISKMKERKMYLLFYVGFTIQIRIKYILTCSYCCFMTPVDIYFVGVLCQHFICHNFIDALISGGLIPHNFFYFLQGNNDKRVIPRGTKPYWVNPYQFILAFCKGSNIKRFVPRVTKPHWVHP